MEKYKSERLRLEEGGDSGVGYVYSIVYKNKEYLVLYKGINNTSNMILLDKIDLPEQKSES